MADRKYKQPGYQDDDGPKPSSRGGVSGPRERPEGPRGRGLGAPASSVFRCGACGQPIGLTAVAADSLCPHCGAALHACINCAFFDTAAPRECRQPIAERVARKRAANSCGDYAVKLVQEFAQEPSRPPSEDPRSAFDALFKI